MSTHDEDILQHRINAYEKKVADLEEQLDRAWVQIARHQAELAEYKAKGAAHIRMLAVNNDELRAQIATKDSALREAFEEAAKIAEAYDRQPFPGFEAGIKIVKKDIAHRIRKAALARETE